MSTISRSTKYSKSNSLNSSIPKPNTHKINIKKLMLWLGKCDESIKSIANEFILHTTYISHRMFIKRYKQAISEMMKMFKPKKLQIYLSDDNINKSGYWILQIIRSMVKIDIVVINNVDDIDETIPVIIADDASYSGSQIYQYLEDFANKKCDIFILIPYISNTAIDIINGSVKDYNIDGTIYFLDKSLYIMKPIYELMDKEKIEKFFIYYSIVPKNTREYPIYFDHKVADNYSSFPLIYTYGIVPNNHNKAIIHECKTKRIPLKNKFSELERMPILTNCDINIPYNLGTPQCPLQPYKENFVKNKSNSKKSPNSAPLLLAKSKSKKSIKRYSL